MGVPASPSGSRPSDRAAAGVSPVPASILNALDLARSLNSDAAGEVLRLVVFEDDFDLIDGFTEVAADCLSLDIRTALLGCFAKDEGEVSRIHAHLHDESGLLVAWQWDGDCSMVFAADGLLLSNSDYTHDREWVRQGDGDDWITGYWDESAGDSDTRPKDGDAKPGSTRE